MRILDRYLIKSFVASIFYCLAVFFILFVIIDAFNNLDEFLKSGASIMVILSYYLYFIPTIAVQVVPIAALVSVLFVIGNLSRHSEITALKASGISAFHILAPYFFIGILISFSTLLLNEMIVPNSALNSASIMNGMIKKGKKDFSERSIQNVTVFGRDNRMIYAREFELSDRSLHDVVIFEEGLRSPLQTKIMAKKAKFEDGRWTLYESMRYQINRRGDVVGEPVYSEKVLFEMEQKPEDFIREGSEIEYMNSRQLKNYIDHLKDSSRKLARKLSVDLHYKIAFPFVSFVIILIGAPLAMKTGRGGIVMGIGTSFGMVLAYYGIDSVCLALGKGGYLPPFFAAWFSNVLFGAIGIYLIKNTA